LGDTDIGSDVEETDPQIREIVQRIVHPNYEPPSVYNDIGLFRLNAPVQFNRFILPICLNTETQLTTEQNLIAIGWGRTGPGILLLLLNVE
jgi:transmembrane serine protease 9